MFKQASGGKRLWKRSVWRLLKSLATIYLGVVIMLALLETMLVYPAPRDGVGDWTPAGLEFEDVHFKSADGTPLHGWLVPHASPKHIVLLLHGNGENVAFMAAELAFVRDQFQAAVMAFDYRGYGKSGGSPHEKGILADGEAAHEWLCKRFGVTPHEVVIWGRSLGGGVGVHVAGQHGARVLILDRTFSSLVDTAACHFPWLPVRLMMRNRYPSVERIATYNGPIFQVHGQPDEVIPFHLGKALFEAAPSADKRFFESESLTHNEPWPTEFYQELAVFLDLH